MTLERDGWTRDCRSVVQFVVEGLCVPEHKVWALHSVHKVDSGLSTPKYTLTPTMEMRRWCCWVGPWEGR